MGPPHFETTLFRDHLNAFGVWMSNWEDIFWSLSVSRVSSNPHYKKRMFGGPVVSFGVLKRPLYDAAPNNLVTRSDGLKMRSASTPP